MKKKQRRGSEKKGERERETHKPPPSILQTCQRNFDLPGVINRIGMLRTATI